MAKKPPKPKPNKKVRRDVSQSLGLSEQLGKVQDVTAASYTSDLTDIFLFETTTGVSAYGGGASGLGASPDYSIEGTNAVDKQVSNAEKGFMYGAGTAFAYGAKDHFIIWLVCAVPGLTDTRNNRGIHVSIGDDTSNFVKFHVAGGDTKPRGGIAPYAVRYQTNNFTNYVTRVGSPGAASLRQADHIGGGANTTGTAKFSNFACDAARIGTGYDITGGTSPDADATFAGLASDDESTSEGLFQTADGGYSVQGKMRIGNSGAPCEFTDSNTNLFLIDGLVNIVQTDFTEFLISDPDSILTLENVNFIALGTNNPGRLEVIKPLIDGQDETSYDNSPTSEGTFTGGTGHAVSDVLTLDDEFTTVTVDAVSSGAVTQFTVNATKSRTATAGVSIGTSSTTGSGSGFSITPDTDNLETDWPTLDFTNVGFIDFGETIISGNDSLINGRWIGCDQVKVEIGAATITGNTFSGYEGTANTSYLIWDVNADPDTYTDGCSFTKGTAATHAIELGTNSPTTVTFRNCDFSGYNASNGQNDSTIHVKRSSGNVTINVIGGSGTVSYRTDGAVVTIANNPVTLTITCIDATTLNPISGVRVYCTVSSTVGGYPFETSASASWIGGTCTVTATGHGMAAGQKVYINSDDVDIRGVQTIVSVPTANTFTFSNSGTGTDPAIEITSVLIDGTTNGSGVVSHSRSYSTDQPITGRARLSTTSPLYRTSPVAGTIDNAAGLSTTLPMIRDD